MDNQQIQELREGIVALELSEEARIRADLALNRGKVERADDKALQDQVILGVLLRSPA